MTRARAIGPSGGVQPDLFGEVEPVAQTMWDQVGEVASTAPRPTCVTCGGVALEVGRCSRCEAAGYEAGQLL